MQIKPNKTHQALHVWTVCKLQSKLSRIQVFSSSVKKFDVSKFKKAKKQT